jgi:hypothetical protein
MVQYSFVYRRGLKKPTKPDARARTELDPRAPTEHDEPDDDFEREAATCDLPRPGQPVRSSP